MKLTIDSPNPGTWCEGDYLTLSPEILCDLLVSGDLRMLHHPEPGYSLHELVNDSSRFSTQQYQFLAILFAYSPVVAELLARDPRWRRFMEIMQASMAFASMMGLDRAGALESFTVHMISENNLDLSAPRPESFDFTLDPDYIAENSEDILARQFYYVPHLISVLLTAPERTDLLKVFAECAYNYARTSEHLTEWLIAAIIGLRITQSLIDADILSAEVHHYPLG